MKFQRPNCKGDGVADNTDALNEWLQTIKRNGTIGLLGGRHRIRRGVLKFLGSTSHVPGPVIHTAPGTTLVAIPGTSGPMLSIESTTAGRYIVGGEIGQLTFEDTTNDSLTDGHGLQLSGVERMKFGHLSGFRLRGDVVHLLDRHVSGNSDFYHVALCTFDGIAGQDLPNESNYVFNNNVLGQGASFINIGFIKANTSNAWRGAGAAIHCESLGCGKCPSWAVDWFNSGPLGGTISRSSIGSAEIDAPRFGIRVQRVRRVNISNARIVHRRAGDPGSGGNWPELAVSIGGGTDSPVVVHSKFEIEHRIQPDVTQLGTLWNFNGDSGVGFVTSNVEVSDPTGLVTDSNLFTNFNPSSVLRLRRDGRTLRDTYPN